MSSNSGSSTGRSTPELTPWGHPVPRGVRECGPPVMPGYHPGYQQQGHCWSTIMPPMHQGSFGQVMPHMPQGSFGQVMPPMQQGSFGQGPPGYLGCQQSYNIVPIQTYYPPPQQYKNQGGGGKWGGANLEFNKHVNVLPTGPQKWGM